MTSRVRRLSFRTRLSTLIAAAVGVTVALAALASYFTVRHQLYSQVDSTLVSEIAAGSNTAADNPFGVRPNGTLDLQDAARRLARMGGYIQLINGSGVVAQTSFGSTYPQPTPAQTAVASSSGGYRIGSDSFDGEPYRVITERVFISEGPAGLGPVDEQPLAVQIWRPLTDVYHTLSTLRLILWLVTLGGIAAAVAAAFVISRTTMRPVARLTAAAEHVAATQDLGSTIEEDGDDELARLARSFNAMLTALADSREQQAQLISDAGHELRTPLTSLRTNIEVLMRVRNLPSEDRADLVHDVEAQLEELTTLIGDLVDLARQEEKQPEPIEVRFDDIVGRAVERARRRATGVTFETHLTPGSVRAQPAMLERAVLNVLDNAAKWSPPGGTVEVWLQRGGCWTLDIHDHGPGIAPGDLPHVFDRFYRADTARSMPGSGLGLAIVHQVVTNHGGTLTASVPPGGGTLVHVELPTVVEMEAEHVPERLSPPPPRAPDQAAEAPPPPGLGSLRGR